jgi:hypothetical protein
MKTELKHGDFKQLDSNLWILEGELPHHMPLPRTMTVYRRRNGDLWIHSAIALDDARQAQLEALGRPTYLVVPSTMHRLDAPIYKQTYPHIKVVCPEAARETVAEKVPVDNSCENEFQGTEIKVVAMPGAKPIELAYELTLDDGRRAMVFNDLLVNVEHPKGFLGKALSLIGRMGPFRTPPSNKLLLLNDRERFHQWLEEQSHRTDLKIITVAHGAPVTDRIPQRFAQAALQV